MKIDESYFAELFRIIPLLKSCHPQDFRIDRVSCFTNNNYRLRNQQHDWILRVPKDKTNIYINRDNEALNIQYANTLGLAPKSLWRSPGGLSLTPTCRQTRNFRPQDIYEKALREKLMLNICRLHTSDNVFHGSVDLLKLLPEYLELVPKEHKPTLKPFVYEAITKYSLIEKYDNKRVPSHNDLVLENILVEGPGRIWIIDWEYSAMASPYWDLATLCNASRLDAGYTEELLALYKKDCAELELDILLIYQFLLQLLSICWMAVFTEQDLEYELDYLNSFYY